MRWKHCPLNTSFWFRSLQIDIYTWFDAFENQSCKFKFKKKKKKERLVAMTTGIWREKGVKFSNNNNSPVVKHRDGLIMLWGQGVAAVHAGKISIV